MHAVGGKEEMEREDNGGEMGRFPLETQKAGIGHRRGSAFYSLAAGTPCPGSALAGEVRIKEQYPRDCPLNLLYSPWSKDPSSSPSRDTIAHTRDLMGQEPHHRWGKCRPSGVAQGCLQARWLRPRQRMEDRPASLM